MGQSSYEDNMYNWLKRHGYAQKFGGAGIYAIRIDDQIVYVGKSEDMLRRVAQHYVAIKRADERKYRILAEAQRKGHCIGFDVLYYAKERHCNEVIEEIGEKEGEYIRKLRPALNYQIPREWNWRYFTTNPKAKTITLSEILDNQNPLNG